MELGAEDKSRSVGVHSGEIVTLTLPENPSTGFRWEVDGSANALLHLESSEYVPPAGAPPGVAGRHVWRYKAIAPGQVTLSLSLTRSWEANAPAADEYAVTLNIAR
jgi:inhibitor of cysteine peptidase